MTKDEMKVVGYFSRLDPTNQQIMLEILKKSLRMRQAEWSKYCFELLQQLDQVEKMEDNTINLFNNQNGKD